MAILLAAARINAGLKQSEAAKQLGINRNTLLNYESYKTKPDIEMGKRIAALYGMSVDDIIWSK